MGGIRKKIKSIPKKMEETNEILTENKRKALTLTPRIIGLGITILCLASLYANCPFSTSWIVILFQLGLLLLVIGYDIGRYVNKISEPTNVVKKAIEETTVDAEKLRRRANHLDQILHWVRTGASILVATTAAIIAVLISNSALPVQSSYGVMAFAVGAFLLAMSALLSIAESLRYHVIRDEQILLGEGLIASSTESKIQGDHTIDMLLKAVQSRENSVLGAKKFLANGLLYIAFFGVMGINLLVMPNVTWEAGVQDVFVALAIIMALIATDGVVRTIGFTYGEILGI
ncbi:MAG: hypothetical protein P1Q69_03140 [Candidatus Thorarchaeota archaeon]|nr:hypothetical protein [Candidatus Thorarchaeota archaeon]